MEIRPGNSAQSRVSDSIRDVGDRPQLIRQERGLSLTRLVDLIRELSVVRIILGRTMGSYRDGIFS